MPRKRKNEGDVSGTPAPAAAPPPAPPPAEAPADTRPITSMERPVTPRQLANFLQVHPKTIGRLVRRGGLPSIRVGSDIRFIPADVMAHLKKERK